ncbi:MAG: hypothetical protein LBT32_07850 [Peptococcaceae bacterium]|nr:hypothetical protein [Peptococcaceae bacterium]
MSVNIEIIDHTMHWIAGRQPAIADYPALVALMKKYPVACLDFLSCDEPLSHYMRCALPVRIEAIPCMAELSRIGLSGHRNIAIKWKHGQGNTGDLSELLDVTVDLFDQVFLKLTDAPALDNTTLGNYVNLLESRHVSGLIYCDDESRLEPQSVLKRLRHLRQKACCALEFCGGNAHGLATANTFAALCAGITRVHTSVGGTEKAVGAAMEEMLMCAKRFLRMDNVAHTENLASDCEAIMQTAQVEIPLNKAIIGKDIFAHESGIHVDGVIKNPKLYESIEPQEVGLTRRLVIGKHSGQKSIRMKLTEWGFETTDELTDCLIAQVKQIAAKQQHALADSQLKDLYDKTARGFLLAPMGCGEVC